MKDKNRLSGMICYSVSGFKVDIAIVGKAARPQCWDLCDNKPPLPYTNQANGWYDSARNRWWFYKVFIPQYKKKFGELHGLLITDNKGTEGVHLPDVPHFMHIETLPAGHTTRHQKQQTKGHI